MHFSKGLLKFHSAKSGLRWTIFIEVTPNSGSFRATLSNGSFNMQAKFYRQQGTSNEPKVLKVPKYRVWLANGVVSTSTTVAFADLTWISSGGAVEFPQVQLNVITGGIAPHLVGKIERLCLGIPTLWDLISR